MSRGFSLYCLRSEGESGVLVGVCKRCAVTLAALGSQSRSSTAPSRPDAPTKPNLVAVQILPGRPQTETRDYDPLARRRGRVAELISGGLEGLDMVRHRLHVVAELNKY